MDNITNWFHLKTKLRIKCFKWFYSFQQFTWAFVEDTSIVITKWPFGESTQHAEWVPLLIMGFKQLNNTIDLKKKNDSDLSRNLLLKEKHLILFENIWSTFPYVKFQITLEMKYFTLPCTLWFGTGSIILCAFYISNQ